MPLLIYLFVLIWSVWVSLIVVEWYYSLFVFSSFVQTQIVWTEDEWSHNNWIPLLPYRMTRIQFRKRRNISSRWWWELNNASVSRSCCSPLCSCTLTHTQSNQFEKFKFWKIREKKLFQRREINQKFSKSVECTALVNHPKTNSQSRWISLL